MRILIVKASSLGDIVHSFDALEEIKYHHPGAVVDWVVEKPFEGLLAYHPLVSNVITINSKRWVKGLFKKVTWREIFTCLKELRSTKYDVVFDFQGNLKSSLVLLFTRAAVKVGYGASIVRERINCLFTSRRYVPPRGLNVRDDHIFLVRSYFSADLLKAGSNNKSLFCTPKQEKEAVDKLLEGLSTREFVLIFPFSNWPNKEISKDVLAEFLKKIEELIPSTFLFMWGRDEEKAKAEKLARSFKNGITAPKLSLYALQYLISRATLVIGMDSFPLHLCGTTSTPSFSFFGPSLGQKYKPRGDSHYAFQGICPYKRVFDRSCGGMRSCKTGLCLKDVDTGRVFFEFQRWWEKRNKN